MNEKQKEMANSIDWTDHFETFSLSNFLLEQSFSPNQIKDMVYYIVNDIRKKEIVIEKLKEKDKNRDLSQYEYERDCAKFALGLIDRPCVSDYKFYQKIKKQKGSD